MGRIRVLHDTVINRIAAGEVVERPASVVKELVENALDSGATAIEVRLDAGGKRRIEVRDDGCGMDRDDALLALERHATSKLVQAEQLASIMTLGFRGEALASIAAVSHLTLQTSDGTADGTEIELQWGRIVDVRPRGLPRGTTLRVDRLFGNTPARRKFLRGDATELAHALRWLTRYALAYPERRFSVEHGGRRVLEAAPATGRLERIAQIHGSEFADKLLPFDLSESGARFSGLAGRPVAALAQRSAQHFFVNARAVQDRVLAHAVSAAYENTVPRGRHATVFLFLDLPREEVDVNVHPQKIEVRFRNSSTVHDRVCRAVRSALSGSGAVPKLEELRVPTGERPADQVREAPARYSATSRIPETPPAGRVERAFPLAQFRDSYIVAEDAEGLLLVDQHAAHERVLFERYLVDAEQDRVAVQRLLFPRTFEASPEEMVQFGEERDEFRRLGFVAEPFGGTAVRLDAVPAVASETDPERLFRDLLGEARRVGAVATGSAELRRRLVTTAACHAAIKVHHPLTTESMQALLDRLYATANPTTCPHGRPAVFRLSLSEIERAFRRR